MSVKTWLTDFYRRWRKLTPNLSVPGPRAKPAIPARNLDRQFHKRDYPGSHDRDYRLHLPPDFSPTEGLPLVMVLHGCKQTHFDIEAISQFDTLANTQRFVVLYPFVTNYYDVRVRNCWGWWRSRHSWPGSGEVEDLWQLADEVVSGFGLDRARIHVAGLSSGGGMTTALLTGHPGRFASGAVVAGVAFQESPRAVISLPFMRRQYRPVDQIVDLMAQARNNDRQPEPLLIIHSHGDETLRIRAAKNLRDSWLRYFCPGKTLKPHEQHGRTFGVDWVYSRYQTGLLHTSLVETLFMDGPGHGWYGGKPGEYSYPYAPDASQIIWDFFQRHPRKRRAEDTAALVDAGAQSRLNPLVG